VPAHTEEYARTGGYYNVENEIAQFRDN